MKGRSSDLRKCIGAHLQKSRKAAGFKSANAFADYVGINRNTYTDYEQGRGSLSYERAWQFADVLGVTLDALGGRISPGEESGGGSTDPYEHELIECYRESTSEGRVVILGNARGQRELALKTAEGPASESEGLRAVGMP